MVGPAAPLFLPRIPTHVIAVLVPEARRVLLQELETPHPLRARPEIQVRHHEPGGPAVPRRQVFTIVPEREEIGRVDAGPLEDCTRLDPLEDVVVPAPPGHSGCRSERMLDGAEDPKLPGGAVHLGH